MIEEFAPAKVNLTLQVGPARPDGYHPVDSLVVFADWGDRLTFHPSRELSLDIEGEGAQTLRGEDENLVLKAARLLATAAGLHHDGAAIRLHKQIPLGAGLGGGSADAAAALRGLNRLWALDWPEDMLAGLAAEIGSDIPACVMSRPLRMTGRGERLEALARWPEFPALIVNPRVSVSTARIFALYDDEPRPVQARSTPSAADRAAALDALRSAGNDLQSHAVRASADIETVLEALRETHAATLVRMTGSGSTCFALFESREDADIAAGHVLAQQPGWLVQPVTLQGSHST